MEVHLDEALDLLLVTSLKEIRNRAPHVPGYFENLLWICCLRYSPGVCTWFREELDVIIEGGGDLRRWSDLLQIGIIQAARRQIPPVTEEDKLRWQKLMRNPRYANTAFFTLAPSPLEQLEILETWWEVKPDHPEKTFERVIREGMTKDPERFQQRLRRIGATWDLELRMKFNDALIKQKVGHMFRPVSQTAEV